jgi:mannose/fructose/N-acetylgalactosamine-specific phosphotransferase system component IID
MSHQAAAPISSADRAITVGPIAGIGSSMSWRMLPKLSRTPVMSKLASA